MQLLCIGDIAIADKDLPHQVWMPPAGMIPDENNRILFNCELPIGGTRNPTPRSSGPRLLSHPDSWRVMQNWSPGFATLATNHILDAGTEGLVNTIEVLNQIGFNTVGAGRNRDETEKLLYWETEEGRLAIINWVFPETHPDWMAVPGPNCWPGLDEAREIVARAKGEADWVMVIAHWSDEHFPYPRTEDRVAARELARMGVDLIIGHHPHVVRGMEVVDNCPVFYSTGNFYFSHFPDGSGGWIVQTAPRNREVLGVQVSFRRGKPPEWRVLSFWQNEGQTDIDVRDRAARQMRSTSHVLRQFPDTEYAAWYAIQRARFDTWGYRWHFRVRQMGFLGSARYISRKIYARWKGDLA